MRTKPSENARRAIGSRAPRRLSFGAVASLLVALLLCTSAAAQTFTGDTPFLSDLFGRAVAIDGNIAVVGAPGDDENGQDAGAAYVYEFDGSSWSLLQKIAGTDPGAQFGFSVAVLIDESDLNEGDFIAVGSLLGDGQVDFSGTVTMYRRVDPEPAFAFQQVLAAADGNGFDEFGHAIDLDLSIPSNSLGDDPVYTLAVGAPRFNTRGSDAGAIYICALSPDGTAWACYDKVVPDDIGGGDLLGRSVAVDGDFIVGGATGWPFGANPEGVAYVLRRFNDTGAGFFNWELNNRFKPSDGQAGDAFGTSVTKFGSIIAVGAPQHDLTPNGSEGAVYLFDGVGIAFDQNEDAKILPPDLSDAERFGRRVVLDKQLMAVTDPRNGGRLHVLQARTRSDYRLLETLTVSDPNAGQIAEAMAFSAPNALVGDPIRTPGGAAYILTNQLIFQASFEGN